MIVRPWRPGLAQSSVLGGHEGGGQNDDDMQSSSHRLNHGRADGIPCIPMGMVVRGRTTKLALMNEVSRESSIIHSYGRVASSLVQKLPQPAFPILEAPNPADVRIACSVVSFSVPSASCTPRQYISCRVIFEGSPSCTTRLQPPSQSPSGDLLGPHSV